MSIFETLKKLSHGKRKKPSYIYLDEKDNQIKEIPLKLDSAGALINNYKSAKIIHDSIFR